MSPSRQLPTPAALNELTRKQARTPRTGFSPALSAAIAAEKRSGIASPTRPRFAIANEVFPHRPLFPNQLLTENHWIERWDYSDYRTHLRNEWRMNQSGLRQRASINTERAPLDALSAKGQHIAARQREAGKASSSYPRLMRPRFPNLLSPSGDISSLAVISTTIVDGFRRKRFA